ncbi:ThuA domain-containing protein [Catalinimonas niigatensis]|uniref:ThuA domain-containing protein n=1 Tax=Catalinimonas niigatensis TaxID=1397264 RepID=UPI002665061A|nr:ThuA domain-containing protein [Catalinimonas niigatensis]WPP50781.1 ThuA domain-containing protein [Catalinimonas niigatensis]
MKLKTKLFHTFLPMLMLVMCSTLLTQFTFKASGEAQKKGIRVLMVGGGSSHDFDRWYKQEDVKTLEKGKFANVRYTDHTDSIAHYLPETDVLYLTNNQPIADPKVRKAIFDFVASGKGLVLGHAALWYNWNDWPEYNQQLVSGGSRGHDKYGNFNVNIDKTSHPVTKKVKSFTLDDELYYFEPDTSGPGIEVLATASAEGSDKSFPSVFVVNHEQARIVGLALGHDAASHELKEYQTLLRNAIRWVAGQ